MSGAKIEDLKVLEKVLLHVETNNALSDSPEDIFSKLISSVDSINCSLPKCNIIISNLTKSTDSRKTNGVCEKVNILLKASHYRVLDNSNIKEKHLAKCGPYLNA